MPKAITPVISVILLLLITISVVGFAMLFMQRSVSSASQESEQQLSKQASSLAENFEIININGNQVTVRNKGAASLGNLAFYVDGNPVTASGSSIPKDSVGTFTLDAGQLAQYPGKKLKVSSAGMTKEENADFYKKNTVAYYTFDSTDGRTIKDESGNGNDGTFSGETWNDGTLKPSCPNCPKQVDGKYGKALQFDADNDYAVAGQVLPSNSPFTAEAWVRPSSLSAWKTIAGEGCDGFTMSISGDKVYAGKNCGPAWVGGPTVAANQWYHVAMTFDGTTTKLYVNGEKQPQESSALAYTHSTLYIGSYNGESELFNGAIDEVRVYNRALTQQEISEDMNSAYPIARTVASYSFEKIENNKAWDTHNVVKGKYGSALSFDGVDDYVGVGDINLASFNGMTLSAWVKKANLGDRDYVISKGAPPFQFEIWADNSVGIEVQIDSVDRNLVTAQNVIDTANKWYHLAFAHNLASGAWNIYVDGVSKKSGAQTGTAYTGSANQIKICDHIGAADGRCKGIIDEVRILNKAIG